MRAIFLTDIHDEFEAAEKIPQRVRADLYLLAGDLFEGPSPPMQLVTADIGLFPLSGLFRLFRLCPVSEGFGVRGVLANSLGRPQLSFGREGFPEVRILENRTASALPAPSGTRSQPSPASCYRKTWKKASGS